MHENKNEGITAAIYGLGFIGSAVYYFTHSPNAWEGFVGIGKSLVWPAILVFKALEFFKA